MSWICKKHPENHCPEDECKDCLRAERDEAAKGWTAAIDEAAKLDFELQEARKELAALRALVGEMAILLGAADFSTVEEYGRSRMLVTSADEVTKGEVKC